VEDTLAEHDGVQEAAVVGVDDAKFGQRLEAFVVLVPGAGATPDELKQHVKEMLAAYKVPRTVTVLDELPRGTTGKVLKRRLIERAGTN
jgi:fatty-acyl-CoA synthase